MENKSEQLERKLEKLDWKEWLPIYGIFQAKKDLFADKPSIINDIGEARYYGHLIYQAASTVAIAGGTIYGLSQLVEKLF